MVTLMGESGHSGDVLSGVTNIRSTWGLHISLSQWSLCENTTPVWPDLDVSNETRKPKYLCEIPRFSRVRNAFQILEVHVWARPSPRKSTLQHLANLQGSR